MESSMSTSFLEEIGWGKYNKIVFLQCGIAWSTEMLWEANVAYILEGSKTDYNLTGLETGALGSCFTFGLLIGTLIWGIVGDRYGRMYAFKSTVCISAIFSLVLTFSVNYYMIGSCLIMIGIGMGVSCP